MARRFPLWLTLVPLAAGIAGYWTIWTGFRDRLAADIARVAAVSTPDVGGFPYRVEAALGAARAGIDGPGLKAQVAGDDVVVNRGPWQEQLTIVRARGARASVAIPPLSGATLAVTAPVLQASLHLIGARIVRLSAVFDAPVLHFGVLPVPIKAGSFEFHLRETPGEVSGTAPTPPRQLQLVLSGQAVRFGAGDPLTLAADFALTAPARVRSYADWRPTGTIELRSFALSDATGAVVSGALTAVPAPDGRLRFAGTLTTVCPATLRAALTGAPPPSEQRTRMPVRIAVGGLSGDALQLDPEGGWTQRATRGQQPACPALRR